MAQKHLKAVTKAARAIDAAREQLADAILEALDSGETVVDIGKAAGLGRSRVYELIREARQKRESAPPSG